MLLLPTSRATLKTTKQCVWVDLYLLGLLETAMIVFTILVIGYKFADLIFRLHCLVSILSLLESPYYVAP